MSDAHAGTATSRFGDVTAILLGDVEELWDAVTFAEYPSLSAFHSMAISTEMRAMCPHVPYQVSSSSNVHEIMIDDAASSVPPAAS